MSDRLALLYRLAQTFNASLNLAEVLRQVVDEVVAATHAERGCVVLVEGAGALTFHAHRGGARQPIAAADFQLSQGVVEHVTRTGQALLTSDAKHDAPWSGRASVQKLALRSILCAPLKHADRILGALYVDSRLQAGLFVPADLELLEAIAAPAALAIENARLFQATQSTLNNLRLLYDLGRSLTATLDLNEVFTACLERVLVGLEAQAASILTLDGEELVFRVAVGEKAATIKPFRLPSTRGVAGWVFQNKQGLIVPNARADPRFYAGTDAESGFITEDILAVPLLVQDRALGVLEVFNKRGGFKPADLELLEAIASTAAIAIENAQLYQVAVEKGRMEQELQLARVVQSSLLPRQVPQVVGWEFAAAWQPARAVSGDFYDFFAAPNALGVCIADVTDKGLPAALFMALTRSLLRGADLAASTLAAGIGRVNALLCVDSYNGMFVTMFYLVLRTATGTVTYVNAGHNPPLLYRHATHQLESLTRTGMVLGVDPEVVFAQRTVQLEPGDVLLCYTDGITDALNQKGEVFGLARLENILLTHAAEPASALKHAIQHDLRHFTRHTAPFDDITFVIIKRVELHEVQEEN